MKKVRSSVKDDINSLYVISRKKGLMMNARAVDDQYKKLEDRNELLEKTIEQKFGKKYKDSEAYDLMKRYTLAFGENVRAITMHVTMMEGVMATHGMMSSSSDDAASRQDEHAKGIDAILAANNELILKVDKLCNQLNNVNSSFTAADVQKLDDYSAAMAELNNGDSSIENLMSKYN